MKNEPIRDEFLEKRKMRQRKARKKKLITSFVFFLTALLITAVILCLTVFFPIENITSSGSKIYSSEEIIGQSGITKGDNIFTFGEKNSIAQLKNRLPFIESVSFERQLPNTLNIKVKDAKAYYCYKQGKEFFNVSKSGWVLESVQEKDSNAFQIIIDNVTCKVGNQIVFENEKQTKVLNNLITLLEENGIKIDYINVTDTINLTLGVDGRFEVELGTENDIESKIKQLKTMIKSLNKGQKGLIRLYMWNQQNPDGTFVENYTK